MIYENKIANNKIIIIPYADIFPMEVYYGN